MGVTGLGQAPEVEILSPHLDDAVYSCWHALSPQARVVTVFCGYPEDERPSDWDVSTGFQNSREAIEARLLENARALEPTGAATLNLSLKDTVFREPFELTAEDVAKLLRDVLTRDVLILAPAGFSYNYQHPDHALVRDAAKILLSEGKTVEFYADVPYSLPATDLENWPGKLPKDELARRICNNITIKSVSLTPPQSEAKRKAVMTYVSQFYRNNCLADGVLANPLAYRREGLILPNGQN